MSRYHKEWIAQGKPSYTAIAKHFGVNESTARSSIKLMEKRIASQSDAEPAILDGMADLGFTGHPDGGWVKSQKPDEHGRTYSFRFSRDTKDDDEAKMDQIAERFTATPPILFTPPKLIKTDRIKKAFVSINDLHSGSLAWGAETGYGDWDLSIAMDRLQVWLSRLFAHIAKEEVSEIILYFNGDILHTNGQVPMTATPGSDHVLDTDSRHFKVVDQTAENLIFNTDIAAQIAPVRLVIKRGNHDGDSYLSLLQGAKWRYMNQENVTVEMEPNSYWAHIFGKVALFGHHGDRIKPERLVMQFLQRYRKVEQFPGIMWEQASNWCEPDLYGTAFGETAMAQAVIYDEIEGETSRFTVKASQLKGD